MNPSETSRRTFLKTAAITGGALVGTGLVPGLSPLAFARGPRSPLRDDRKTKHIVLIAFAGGVRTKETFGMPANVPNLTAMADEGVLFPRVRTANLGHFGASMSIFTGISEPRGIRENSRGPDPTLFEYLRKDLGLPQSDVWITTSGGAQQVNYSYGLHADYGPKYGANTLDGDGIFNKEFQEVLEAYGMPKPMGEGEKEILDRLRGSLGAGDEESAREAEALARVEQYILDELTRGTSDITGAGAADAKALRLARNLLSIFKPRVVGVVLQNADIAHGSFNGYMEVIRRNDAAVGELWNAVKDDAELADSTAFIILPEFGRDADLNARRGLDHGDGSDDLNYVSCVAWGPDFKRGAVVRDVVRTIDVTPTICDLLGASARHSRGGRMPGLYA
ncbi:MAG: twin-arginine translocation signal domain-containing protein [Planctomycetota bacterium]|nr:MAG: twin-arginine translocation signal domain-containing protein [Planctomycetota bacterium]